MKKKLLSIVLTLALCLSLLPTAALAADPADISGGYTATLDLSSSDADFTAGSGSVSLRWDDTEPTAPKLTLTLDNATIGSDTTTAALDLTLPDNAALTVELKGTNTLTGRMTIHGSSSGVTHTTIQPADDATGASLSVTHSSTDVALSSSGSLTIQGGVAVTVENTDSGSAIRSTGSLTINAGSTTVTASSSGSSPTVFSGAVTTISDGASATFTNTGSGCALDTTATPGATPPTALTVNSGSSSLNLTSYSGSALDPNGHDVTINGKLSLFGDSSLSGAFTVQITGSVTVNPGTTLTFATGSSLTNNGTFVNNGTLIFSTLPTISSLRLTGTGYVKTGSGSSIHCYSPRTGTELTNVSSSTLTLSSSGISPASTGCTWNSTDKTLTLENIMLGQLQLDSSITTPITIVAKDYVNLLYIIGSSLGANYELNIQTANNSSAMIGELTLNDSNSGNATVTIGENSEIRIPEINAGALTNPHTLKLVGSSKATSKLASNSISLGAGALTMEKLTANVGSISCSTNAYSDLTLDNATVTAASINWNHNSGTPTTNGLVLKNASTLTVTGYDDFAICAGQIKLNDNDSKIHLNGGYLSTNHEGNLRTDGADVLSYCPASGYTIGRAPGSDPDGPSPTRYLLNPSGARATGITLQRHYTVTFDPHGGSFNNDVLTNSQFTSTTATSPVSTRGTAGVGLSMPGISRVGHTFAGWSPSAPSSFTSDITLTAQWTAIFTSGYALPVQYKVVTEKGAGGTIDPPSHSFEIAVEGASSLTVGGNTVTTIAGEDTQTGSLTFTGDPAAIYAALCTNGIYVYQTAPAAEDGWTFADANKGYYIKATDATTVQAYTAEKTGGVWASTSTPASEMVFTNTYTKTSSPSHTPSGSGSGSTDYRVTVSEPVNGTVEASRRFAEAGTTITVTTAAASSYGLETLTVLDRNNREVALTDLGGGKYTFKMPSSNVTVSAYFTLLPNFDDVDPGDYFYDPVRWAVNNGITDGIGGGKFGPDLTCTRAQIVTFLWRTSGQPIAERTEMPFTDVAPNSFYYDAVLWAIETGVTLGTSDTTFSPDLTCSREQAVTFLYRYAQLNGIDTTQGGMAVREFTDYESISDFALDTMRWAVNAGIVQGAGGKLMPLSDCTRGQIVTMLYRTMNP